MKMRSILRLVPAGLVLAVAAMTTGCGPMVYDSNPHFSHHRNHRPPKPPKPHKPPKHDKHDRHDGHRDRH